MPANHATDSTCTTHAAATPRTSMYLGENSSRIASKTASRVTAMSPDGITHRVTSGVDTAVLGSRRRRGEGATEPGQDGCPPESLVRVCCREELEELCCCGLLRFHSLQHGQRIFYFYRTLICVSSVPQSTHLIQWLTTASPTHHERDVCICCGTLTVHVSGRRSRVPACTPGRSSRMRPAERLAVRTVQELQSAVQPAPQEVKHLHRTTCV